MMPWMCAFVASVLSGQSAQQTVRVAKFSGDRAAAISYTFDDGTRDQYTLAVPMLNEVGFRGTFFVIPGSVVESVEAAERKQNDKRAWGSITWSELRTMADQGHEIASHTWSHRALPKLSPQEVDAELSKAADEIKKQIGRPPLTIAFPFNQSTLEIKSAVRKYHAASRDYQTGVGGAKSTVQWLDDWTDKQVREHAWGIIMAHAIGRGYAAFTDPEIFRTHLHHVKSREREIWVDTFANVSRYVKERDDATLTILRNESGRVVCTLVGSGSLAPDVFNVPLTLVIQVAGATNARAERAGNPLPVRVSTESIQIDATPDAAPITVSWH